MINFEELEIPDASPVLTKEKWNGLLQWVAENPPNLTADTLKLSSNKDATLKEALSGLNEELVINPKRQFKSVKISGDLKVDTGKIGSYNEDLQLCIDGNSQMTLTKSNNVVFNKSATINLGPWHMHQTGGGTVKSYLYIKRRTTGKINTMLAIDWSGNVGIGTTNPLYKLSLGSGLARTKLALYQSDNGKSSYGLGVTAGKFYFNIGNPKARYVFLNQHGNSAKEIFGIDGAGNVKARSYGKSSDRRLKKEILTLEYGLKEIEKMNPVNYTYNGLGDSIENQKDIGFIAQELEKIAPYLVSKQKGKLNKSDKTETELLNIIPANIIPILVNAVKELSQKVKSLEAKSTSDLIMS